MDKLFTRRKTEAASNVRTNAKRVHAGNTSRINLGKPWDGETRRKDSNVGQSRAKLKDGLESSDARLSEPNTHGIHNRFAPTTITGKDRSGILKEVDDEEVESVASRLKLEGMRTSSRLARVTRSTTRKDDPFLDSYAESLQHPEIDLGAEWKKYVASKFPPSTDS
jgi:hypothetical protein